MKSGSRSPQRGFKHPSPGLVSRGEVNDGTKVVARLRHHVFTALRRHERLRGDAVGGLQLRLANGQRAVRDRRSDETAMGLAGHRLHLACNRLRLGRLGIGSWKPPPARRGRLGGRLRTRRPRLALCTDARPRRRVNADRYHAHRLCDHDGSPDAARDWIRGSGIWKAVSPLFHREHGDPHRVWRSDRIRWPPDRGKSAHAVGRDLGAHQHRHFPLVGRGAGHRAPAPSAVPRQDHQTPGSHGSRRWTGRPRLRRGARRVRAQLCRTRRDRRRCRGVLARRKGRRSVGWPPHARGRRTLERRHDGRRHVQHQRPRGDDAGGGEGARLARLRRPGRRLLARVRAEWQGRSHRAPAPRPRGGARPARREADDREAARHGLHGALARAPEAGVAAWNAPRLSHDDARAVHAGADPSRRPGAPHARSLLPGRNRRTAGSGLLYRAATGDSRRAHRKGEATLPVAWAPGPALHATRCDPEDDLSRLRASQVIRGAGRRTERPQLPRGRGARGQRRGYGARHRARLFRLRRRRRRA